MRVGKTSRCFCPLSLQLDKRWEDYHVPIHSVAYLINPAFVKYPIFDDLDIIREFKLVVRYLKLNTSKVLTELEWYRTGHDPEGVSSYQSLDSIGQNLPNPLMFWRYYCPDNITELPKLAKVLFNMLPSSSICERNFRDHEYLLIFVA